MKDFCENILKHRNASLHLFESNLQTKLFQKLTI